MSTPQNEPAYVSAPVARRDYLGGISEVTEWRLAKKLVDWPPVTRIGARKYYKVSDLCAFMESRTAV
jgi:hypothetical protein